MILRARLGGGGRAQNEGEEWSGPVEGDSATELSLTIPEDVRFCRGLEAIALLLGEIGGVVRPPLGVLLKAVRLIVGLESEVCGWPSARKAGGGNRKEDSISVDFKVFSDPFKSVEPAGVGGAFGRGMLETRTVPGSR